MSDDENAAYEADELAIIELWDSLPDYCRTDKFWQQVKTLCPSDLLNKLETLHFRTNR